MKTEIRVAIMKNADNPEILLIFKIFNFFMNANDALTIDLKRIFLNLHFIIFVISIIQLCSIYLN